MIKLLITLTFIFFSVSTFAMKAVIISLEAPLFIKQDPDSRIVQRARKGDIVFIHGNEFGSPPYEIRYDEKNYLSDQESMFNFYKNPRRYQEGSLSLSYIQPQLFYKTLNKNGVIAYIQGKHIKVIYKDTRELTDNTPYPEHDKTDYRIEEPLSKEYPFFVTDFYEARLLYAVSPASASNYNYISNISAEQTSSRKGISFSYLKNVGIDTYNRFYFGIIWDTFSTEKSFLLTSGFDAYELKSTITLGPILSYDIYRSDAYRIALFGGVQLSYDKIFVRLSQPKIMEERNFNGFYPSSKLGMAFSKKNFIMEKLQLLATIDYLIHPPHSLSGTDPAFAEIWNQNNNDKISYPLSGYLSVSLGLTFIY